MEPQLNLAVPVINVPFWPGMTTTNLINPLPSGRYIREQPFYPDSSRYITYNIQNDANKKDDKMFQNKYGSKTKREWKSKSKSKRSDGVKTRDTVNNTDNRRISQRRRVYDDRHSGDSRRRTNATNTNVNIGDIGDVNRVNTSTSFRIPATVIQNNTGSDVDNYKSLSNTTLINSLWPSSKQTPSTASIDYQHSNNNNNNSSSSSSNSAIPTNYIIIFSTLFFLVGTIGISGNMLVVYIVLSDGKMRRSMTNMMILNLALADSLILLFGIPEILMVLLDRGWQLGGIACSVNRTVMVCALYASVLTLVAVCIERYIAIVFPIKAHILCTKTRVLFVIAFIWIFSLACSCPTAVFNTVVQISNTPFCITKFHDNRTKHDIYQQIYKYSESALFYIGPLIIQVVCYAVIGKRLFVDLDKLHRGGGGGGGGGGISSASRPNGRGPTRAFNEAMRARKGVVKMLMASVAIYCLSYSPHQILLVYNTFSTLTFDETWIYLVFTIILAYVNSAANPFLYCVFSDNFRTNFKRILHTCMPCKMCCCCTCCDSCASCICTKDQKTQRPMTLHSYTEYTSLVRRNTQKQGQNPIITV